jgi:NAD(P)H-flavin reductase/hemoglobin-like flavoprotein
VAGSDERQEGQIPLNPALVKESFAFIEPAADKVTAYFYGRLFTASPELRALFPLAMDRQRERFFRALARIVWSLDSPAELTSFAGQLGRDHRKFGVTARHYREFMDALLATVREFHGPAWTPELDGAWQTALDTVSQIMTEAAGEDASHAPAWWLAEVTEHERRAGDLAVLTLRPDPPLSYRPGQYVAVQSARRPRQWRNYSIANAPRSDGTITLHVRLVPGGLVSTELVCHTARGEMLLLGPARGTMTRAAGPGRDLLCVAGGTGLAPLKALVEQAAAAGGPAVTLLFGARTEAGLYDVRELRRLAAGFPALEVIPVVSDDPGFGGLRGRLPDVLADRPDVGDRDVYLCGPAEMVRQAQAVLGELGVPAERLHYDEPDAG